MDAAVAEEMGDEAVLRKDPGEGSVADAEAAGIGAEGRHHGTHPVTGETAALHRATARGDARLRMQVAGDLALRAGRLVAEGDRADSDFVRDGAAEIARKDGIVIARNPDPVAACLKRGHGGAVLGRQALMRGAIVKAVAERDDDSRIMAGDDGSEPAQCGERVVGRQEHAAGGEARAFFQMQIGNDEQALLFPEQGAG